MLGPNLHKLSYVCMIIGLLSMSSCYEPLDGCLDRESSNFSFDADRPCDSCCLYPAVVFAFKPMYGDTNFLSSRTYVNELGQSFSVKSYDFIISNARIGSDGSEVGTRERFFANLDQGQGIFEFSNDIIQVSRSGLTVSTPNIRETGDFEKISFDIGPPPTLHDVDISSYTETSNPTHTFEDLYNGQGVDWLNWSISYYIDSITTDTIIVTMDEFYERIAFTADTLYTKQKGINAQFDIEIDFAKWMSGVNLQTMTPEEIADICHTNTQRSFSLVK